MCVCVYVCVVVVDVVVVVCLFVSSGFVAVVLLFCLIFLIFFVCSTNHKKEPSVIRKTHSNVSCCVSTVHSGCVWEVLWSLVIMKRQPTY